MTLHRKAAMPLSATFSFPLMLPFFITHPFGVRMSGAGEIDGVPLIVSNYVPGDSSGSLFILAFASEIYLADDGQVNIDISREATIFLDDAAATATPTAAQLVSMFQTNQLAVRAERYVRWQKRRPQAVAYLSDVDWV